MPTAFVKTRSLHGAQQAWLPLSLERPGNVSQERSSHSLRLREGLSLIQQKGGFHTLNKTDILRKSFPFNAAAINSHSILCGRQLSQRVLRLMAGSFCMSWPGMGGLCTLDHRTEPEKSLPVEQELDP